MVKKLVESENKFKNSGKASKELCWEIVRLSKEKREIESKLAEVEPKLATTDILLSTAKSERNHKGNSLKAYI
jgi:hypothetical protein